MNIFEPLMTYSSPCWTAVVWIPETSEPAFGSVSAKEQRSGSSTSGGSHLRFCSSVPASRTGAEPSWLATIETAMPAQPQASSSPIRIASKAPSPMPPNRSEEHTSELQSHHDLVCRLLLEKKKNRPLDGCKIIREQDVGVSR